MREPKAGFYILELLCVFVLLYIWVEHSHKTFNFFTSLSLSLSRAAILGVKGGGRKISARSCALNYLLCAFSRRPLVLTIHTTHQTF
jgi:hypothetical protein